MKFYDIFVGRKRTDNQGGIYHFGYDQGKNELLLVSQEMRILDFTHLAISGGKTKLFVTGKNSLGKDIMVSYRIVSDSKRLEMISEVELQTAGDVCHLSISPDESIVAVTDFADKAVHFYGVEEDGRIGGLVQRVAFEGSGTSYRQEGSHPHSASFTPDNRYCMVADLGANCLWVLRRSEKKPGFEVIGHWEAPDGSGPRHVAFDKNSRYTYVITEITADVAVLEIQKDGKLRELQVISALAEDAVKNHGKITALGLPEYYIAAGDITVTENGEYIAVSLRGPHEIAVFKILQNGLLSFHSRSSSGGSIRSMRFNEENTILFALGEEMGDTGGTIEVFALNQKEEILLRPLQKTELQGAFICCIA